MRIAAAFATDVRLLWRHGFFWIYVFVCFFYWILLRFIPESHMEMAALALTFSDPSALGLLLAGGIVLLERDQGVHDQLFVTPLGIGQYLFGKAAALSLLSVLAAWAIHLPSVGFPRSPLGFSIGVILTSTLMTLMSIGIAAKCRSINGFIMKSQAYAFPFTLPLLGFFDIWHTSWFLLLPTEGTLLLLTSAYTDISTRQWLYAVFILVVWNFAVFAWTKRCYSLYLYGENGENGARTCTNIKHFL